MPQPVNDHVAKQVICLNFVRISHIIIILQHIVKAVFTTTPLVFLIVLAILTMAASAWSYRPIPASIHLCTIFHQ